jgi:lysophospholipase L1-like esterase
MGNSSDNPDSTYYLNNPVYGFETSMYKLNKLRNPDIVIFGDSHVQGAQWSELLGNYKIINRGVSGDDTFGMKKRLPDVVKLNPKIVVIEGGINDVYNWVPNQTILNNLEYIIRTLKANKIKVIVTSIIFAGKRWGENWIKTHNPELNVVEYNKGRNEVVKQLNRELKKFCKRNNVKFLDLNPSLTSGGFLKKSYSRDELHLNAKGYKIWAQKLQNILNDINKGR